ncbi:hypothetical protein ISS42_00700 [Candidatus Shapirobacteria bacterium]|nr:hypothetical protein [Candidatus Shapirobacteria bacterium]
MRKKLTALVVLALAFLFLNFSSVFASGFNLKSIGNLNTDGKLYPQWWYSSLQPTFAGEAAASSAIDITIDAETYQATTDIDGNWSFTPPATLSAGDHSITLTNAGSTISFTLTLGSDNVDWDSISSSGSATLPTVGFVWPTIFMVSTGLTFILLSHSIEKGILKKG